MTKHDDGPVRSGCKWIALAVIIAASALGAEASAAMPAAVAALASAPAAQLDPIPAAARCIGNRRDYRDYNHCWQRRSKSRRAAAYCSRICS